LKEFAYLESPVWVGRIREDPIAEDGRRIRIEFSVVFGTVCELSENVAQPRLSERPSDWSLAAWSPRSDS